MNTNTEKIAREILDIIFTCVDTINDYGKCISFDDTDNVFKEYESILKWVKDNDVKDYHFSYCDCGNDMSDSFVFDTYKTKCDGKISHEDIYEDIYSYDYDVEENEERNTRAYNENYYISGNDTTWYVKIRKI